MKRYGEDKTTIGGKSKYLKWLVGSCILAIIGLAGKVEFVKVNVDENPAEAAKYGVMGIPTFIVLKDGKEIARKVGFTSKAELIKLFPS